MKRFLFSIVFACCTLGLAAQEGFPVKYQGDKPTISDFVPAYLDITEEEDCDESKMAFTDAWNRYHQNLPLQENETLTVDQRSGYVVYESRYEESLLRIEVCYWNESDQKHKLMAYNVTSYLDGKYALGQFDGIAFFRYTNATKHLLRTDDVGFEPEYYSEDGAMVSYALPRSGKDIIVTHWYDNGTNKQKVLKWGGRRFSL